MPITEQRRRPRRQMDHSPALAAAVFATELDWMASAHYGDVVHGLTFGHRTPRQALAALNRVLVDRSIEEVDQLSPAMDALVEQLCDFAAGRSADLSDIRINLGHLTAFGRRVVAACRRIPLGQTRTYGQLAAVAGSPGAARAVGQVMAKNRYPLIVPCHRVLAAGGALGGFSAPQGVSMKRRLLAMEADTLVAAT